MKLEVVRHPAKPWGIDGVLRINGRKVCDTVEHPTRCRDKGEYPLSLSRQPFRHGDGPMRSVKGEIIVGKQVLSGLVTQSAITYEKVYNRLKKEFQRHHPVILVIR